MFDAQTLDDTADLTEQSYCPTLVGVDRQVADDVTATVVVTLKALHAGRQGSEGCARHVDVGRLQHMDPAVAHQLDILVDGLQVGLTLDFKRVVGRSLA